MLTGRCEVESTLPHPASTGLDADHQTPSGVHPGVGLPARRLDFVRVFTRTREVDPGFFDPFCGVGNVAPPGHVAPEERERWSPWRRVVQCCVNSRESEGLRDGRYRPRVLALVEQRDALPQTAGWFGEPVEALQGSL